MQSNWNIITRAGQIEADRIRRASKEVKVAQTEVLAEILKANCECAYLKQFFRGSLHTLENFRNRVPIASYEDFAPYIEKISDGAKNQLTQEALVCMEVTGGSHSGGKFIPYTNSLIEAFRRSVTAWLASLIQDHPSIANGSAYFSISPINRQDKMIGQLPIGLPSDAAYFGEELVPVIGSLLVGAHELSALKDVNIWRMRTIAALLEAKNLSMISVWSPTFLTNLLEFLINHTDQVFQWLGSDMARFGDASRRLEMALRGGALSTEILWPNLSVISAWGDASSQSYVGQIEQFFPNVYFQPKGLLATEAVITIPLEKGEDPIPALTSTFLEFEDRKGDLFLMNELKEGEVYQVIITTQAGLYRYRIGDQVVCTKIDALSGGGILPRLRFVGRESEACDLVGEKMTGAFVSACFNSAGIDRAILIGIDGPRPHYIILQDREAPVTKPDRLERLLNKNPQYSYARSLNQLGEVEIVRVRNLANHYTNWRFAQGQRYGDVKMPTLAAMSETQMKAIWPDFERRRVECP